MNSSPALILLGGALGGMLIGDGLNGKFLKYGIDMSPELSIIAGLGLGIFIISHGGGKK